MLRIVSRFVQMMLLSTFFLNQPYRDKQVNICLNLRLDLAKYNLFIF